MAEELMVLWRRHQQEALPNVPDASKGELWVIDEVVGGCIAYYLERGPSLDSRRIGILEDCRADLDRLIPELEGEAVNYFRRLGTLAQLVLTANAFERKSLEGGADERSSTL
jgi:hypothetical protein